MNKASEKSSVDAAAVSDDWACDVMASGSVGAKFGLPMRLAVGAVLVSYEGAWLE